LAQLGEVRGHVLGNLGSHLRLEFLKKRVINFPAGSQETAVNVCITRKNVQTLSQLPDKSFAGLEFNIMPLTVGHRSSGPSTTGAAWEPACLVRDLIYQAPVRFRIVILLKKLQPGSCFELMIIVFEFKRFEASKISDHEQCVHDFCRVKFFYRLCPRSGQRPYFTLSQMMDKTTRLHLDIHRF